MSRANQFELQIALGHTTLEMTRRYTQALGFDDVFKRHEASPVDRLILRQDTVRPVRFKVSLLLSQQVNNPP
jgi:hypothetical protein